MKLQVWHSIECITHSGHSIAFLHFVTLTFDLSTPKPYHFTGYPKVHL